MAFEILTGDLAMLSQWRSHHYVCLQLADILLINWEATKQQPSLTVSRQGTKPTQQIFGMKSNLSPLSHTVFLHPSECVRLQVPLSLPLSPFPLFSQPPLEATDLIAWEYYSHQGLRVEIIMSQTSESDCYLWASEVEHVKSWKTK